MRDDFIDNEMDERADYPSIRANKNAHLEEETELEYINQLLRSCEMDWAEDQMGDL